MHCISDVKRFKTVIEGEDERTEELRRCPQYEKRATVSVSTTSSKTLWSM